MCRVKCGVHPPIHSRTRLTDPTLMEIFKISKNFHQCHTVMQVIFEGENFR